MRCMTASDGHDSSTSRARTGLWYGSAMQELAAVPLRDAERRPLVIANPAAGRGRTGRDLSQLIAAVRGAVGDLDVAETRRRGDAAELAAVGGARAPPARHRAGRRRHARRDRQRPAAERRPPNDARLGQGHPSGGGMTGPAAGGRPSRCPASCARHRRHGHRGRLRPLARHPARARRVLAALEGGADRAVDVGWARFPDLAGRPVERYWINVLSAGVGGLVDRYTASAPAALGGRLAYAQATLRAIVMCRRVRLVCDYIDQRESATSCRCTHTPWPSATAARSAAA